MNEKLNIKVEDRLLEARKEGLRQFHETSMRPHGKLWGMDVFSWSNPNAGLISNTLHSFPFPVIWIGNGSTIIDAINEEEDVLANLHSIIAYDFNVFNLKDEWLTKVKNCAGTETVEQTFEFLKMFKAPQTVLMFTSSGEKQLENMKIFDDYLKLVQL